MFKLDFADVVGIAGIALTILLVVLDKAGKLKGGWLLILLCLAGVMTIFVAVGNGWVQDAPVKWKAWRIALMLCIVGLSYSGIGLWISGSPSEKKEETTVKAPQEQKPSDEKPQPFNHATASQASPLSEVEIKELAKELAKQAPPKIVTVTRNREHMPLQDQVTSSDEVTAVPGISDGQISYISDHLRGLGAHEVSFVFVGSRHNARVIGEQLQKAFRSAGWTVSTTQIGMVGVVGLNFPDGSYLTGADIANPVLVNVYDILNEAGVKWNLVPNAFMGPQSSGVALVLH